MTEVQHSTAASRVKRRHLVGGAALGMLASAVGGLSCGIALGQGAPLPQQKPSGRARFADKVIIVTGGTSGIGRAAALMFAAEGGKVVFCGRNVERRAKGEDAIKAGGGSGEFGR